MTSLSELQRDWDHFGQTDPLWAVNTDGIPRGIPWDEDEFFATGRDEVAKVLALADPPAGGRCLDFGCGVGRLVLPFAEHFKEVVGVDIAPSMIEAAERYSADADNVSYVLNERPDLAVFADGTFDFVNASIVFQHMPPALALGYLTEFSRILAPGGLASFTLPSHPAPTLRGWMYRVLPRGLIYAYKRRRDGATMAMNGIPISRLMGELERVGLTMERVRVSASAGLNWVTYRYVCAKG